MKQQPTSIMHRDGDEEGEGTTEWQSPYEQ
jgi:hypothetical protein